MTEDAAALPANNRFALRQVARAQRKAALATSLDGRPYVSLVTLAFDHDLSPILLLSGLADHTRNLRADPRASLLLDGTEGHANPQTGPRVTLVGSAEPDSDPRLRSRFLARHPAAALYAGFGDFGIWRLRIERVHFVGGFARAVWFDAPLVSEAAAAAMATAETGLLDRINALAPEQLAGLVGGGAWQAVGIDLDGVDLASGEASARVDFDTPAEGPEQAWRSFVNTAGQAFE
ncbi:heme iron utilization protein [Paramagnetospirillum marisnigri]|uniref:Heme iron utilization protein n=1 Tax=Paramagnetospirillum marisnigri TaxID=1285242 RepID=A0A178MCU9_9PROT|nr:pyridoxamine 5'-phosphate oxidase family protein [Paramagnetospirillum marisnigri]OAN46589.1 heme iron utilization protein [Paramagnetospirillum marisnigri]